VSQVFRQVLLERLSEALIKAGLDPEAAAVSPSSGAKFGDYQSNVAMVLAKRERTNPRELSSRILEHLDVSGIAEQPEVAGAGFINFRLTRRAIEEKLGQLFSDERLGCAAVEVPQSIVIDFSSPNVAKPMHVGHIRSTILGDCLARIARFLGHNVTTDNHIGDWGTQFGKVIYGWKHLLDREALDRDPIAELVRLYREVNSREGADPEVADAARRELVLLQSGDPENLSIWRECVEASWQAFLRLYDLLGIQFDQRLGESSYNARLEPLCDELEQKGLARISDGALCVFFPNIPGLVDKPALVRKADGGFLYATTDLATIQFRIEEWDPDQIWYVVGAPQALHFQQVFEISRLMGYGCNLRHIAFGSILGEDRKIMKTRSGDNVGLAEVLDEAVTRADTIIREKNSSLPEAERGLIAKQVGIGAVKYAELSQNRLTDYVFSWDKLLAFHGNTAPYLQNAYVRVQSIFRKSGVESLDALFAIEHPAERSLAMHLARYAEVVPLILDDFRPNLLANYLFELAEAFHGFYEACPVLKSEDSVRASRLCLCDLTGRTLRHGLSLMGIECPERM